MAPTNHQPSAGFDDGDLLAALAGLSEEPTADIESRVLAYACRLDAPVGPVHAALSDRGVMYLRTEESFGGDIERFREEFRQRFGRPLLPIPEAPAGLVAALAGRREARIELDLRGSTDFTAEVLRTTARIPAGQTRPYYWIAKEIGRPGAVRAVGSALARNPIPLLVPCHRVIRSDGGLGDYMFGLEMKDALLRREGADVEEVRRLARKRVLYVGSDTTQIYCFPTCHHAKRITARHRRGFRDEAEAQRDGYRPCASCRPGKGMNVSA